MTAAAPVWLFDGVCVLCSRAVAWTLAHERTPSIRFVAIQSPEGRRLAAQHGVDPDAPDTFLFIDQGRVHTKSDGIIALSRHVRGLARGIGAIRILPQSWRNRAYDHLARHRYRWFGRHATCIQPTPEQRARFVLPEPVT